MSTAAGVPGRSHRAYVQERIGRDPKFAASYWEVSYHLLQEQAQEYRRRLAEIIEKELDGLLPSEALALFDEVVLKPQPDFVVPQWKPESQ